MPPTLGRNSDNLGDRMAVTSASAEGAAGAGFSFLKRLTPLAGLAGFEKKKPYELSAACASASPSAWRLCTIRAC